MRIGERTGADVVYGDGVIVDESGRLLRLQAEHRFSARVLREYGCYISSSSTIFRRSVLGQDPWDEGLRKIMDWDLYMKLLLNGATIAYVPHPVGVFRMHPAQVTAASREWHAEYTMVATRYGLARDVDHLKTLHKRVRWLHAAHKISAGSYGRQLRARALRGKDLRWFRSPIGYANSAELLERCYR